ncbi:uncharacterized protein [Hemitrygon akajei]|uniref:uncharacterized protein n=1 Tax=Hemitrygon akajei TaxID=2704970 RepID=UPI003BF96788
MSDVGDESDSFELTILLLDGSQVSVQVKANSTVEDVKFSLISQTSQDLRRTPERMRLLYRQVQLQDDDTVEECGLTSASVVVQDDTTPSGSGTIEYTIAGEFPQGTSADWTPAIELDTNTSEFQSPPERATRFNVLGQHRLKSCDICGFKDEEKKWRVVEPDVSDGDMHFRISLPGEGFYECAITGLRWEIKGAITITYRYCSWSEYAPIILIKKSEFCGPLFNILAEDDIIKAIHLPHFICLKENGKVSFQEGSDEDVSQRESSLPVKEQSLPSTSGVRLSVSDSNAIILSSDEGIHKSYSDYDIFPDTLQEEFLSIQKVIQALGKESAILCDKGTQTEKCSHSSKGKHRHVFCNFSTQTEVTFSDENLQAHKKLHSSIATQTDSNFQHCPSGESHGEVDVLPENKTKEESLKLQPIDSDVEMLRRDKPKLIDESIQTVDTRPPNDHSDKGSIQLSNVTVQTLESGEKKILQSDASLQTEKVQRVQLDSDERTVQEPIGVDRETRLPRDTENPTFNKCDERTVQEPIGVDRETRLPRDTENPTFNKCDERTVQEPIRVDRETRLPRDTENLTFNKCDLSDLIYFEKEQCPCKMPKVKKDKLKWTIITPNVRENGNKKFSIFLPDKGYYECAVTKLRWITKSQVTLTYEYCSWNEYISDVQKQCWIIGSSLFNITTQDGNVEAIYLPHFICETGIF